MAEGLREMAFSDSNLADDENRGMFGRKVSVKRVIDSPARLDLGRDRSGTQAIKGRAGPAG
jgi:hypothetical protein